MGKIFKYLNVFIIVLGIMSYSMKASTYNDIECSEFSFPNVNILLPVVCAEDFTIVDGVLIAYNGTDKDIIIPEGVTVIATSAFYNNYDILSVTTPSTLVKMENEAFASCWYLVRVDLSASINLSSIGNESFVELFELKEFRVPWTSPLLISYANDIFRDTFTGGVTLYVPSGTKELYLQSEVWRDFNIVEDESTLPITLISFTAECDNNNLLVLKWATATETNNSFFTLERSLNGFDFEEIAKVNGAGNSSQVQNYLYTFDVIIERGSYFRLSQTDYNGLSESFPIIYFEDCISKAKDNVIINVYPNPVGNIMKISSNEIINSIDIYDSSKKLIIHQDVHDYFKEINLSWLKNGVYFLKVVALNQTHLQKFIKQ